MIIIDEAAENKLIQALKHMTDAEGRHCIRIHAAPGNEEESRRNIIARTQEHLPNSNLYVCADGEAFLLTQNASVKACRKALLEIADAFDIQPVNNAGVLYDLGLEIGALLILLENKTESRRQAEEEAVKRKAREEAVAKAARKRQEILEHGVQNNAEQIAAQRRLRSEPALMIIEDDPFSRRLVKNVLEKQFALTEFASAEGAISAYAALAPDLLLLDINLPDVTGHELLEKIIALDPNAYVIILSGNSDKANIMQAMQRGATGFVAKPFCRDKLFQYIERCPTIVKENRL